MRRAVILAIVATLAVVPGAFAHVTVTPTRAEPGTDVLLTFVVPNEDAKVPIVGVVMRPPRGFDYEGVEGPAGWRVEHRGRELAWSGGSIAPGTFATFGLTGSAGETGTLVFPVRELFRDGRAPRYVPRLVVAAPAAAPGRDRSAHTLGKAALFVAIAAGAVAVATFFLMLALWLRGGGEPLQERKREPVVRSDA